MTNWPNIQEYRNFEAKFFDNPLENNYNYSGETKVETVPKPGYEHESEEYVNIKPESKTVRCIIKKDFEETFRKLDRGDGIQEPVKVKGQEPSRVDQAAVDKIRLQNHLKWKKQKEEEYLQKKEAERIEQEKKKEEKLRIEQLKRQKEKERQEKLKMWEEQKAREKEEKKKEKMVIKELEQELKVVTPVVNKEKLIEEWVKLKNKQKQMEMEKKAEMMKKEEESKALRQSLAEISYRQWKERVKGRMMTLPKNGYQIFGPKPVPVVKEDWNHDFIDSTSPREPISLRSTKSNATSLSCKVQMKDVEHFPGGDIFNVDELKNRSASFYNLKPTKSKLKVSGEVFSKTQHEMPLKELQPQTVDSKKNWTRNARGAYGEGSYGTPDLTILNQLASINDKEFSLSQRLMPTEFLYPNLEDVDQNCYVSETELKNPSLLADKFLQNAILPNKKKIDLYLNNCMKKVEEKVVSKHQKRTQGSDVKVQRETKKSIGDKLVNESKGVSNGKLTSQKSSYRLLSETNVRKKPGVGKIKKPVKSEHEPGAPCRRSQSYEKSDKKIVRDRTATKGCSSLMKIKNPSSESLKSAKSKGPCCLKRKSRKQSKPNTPESAMKCNKLKTSSELNIRKKPKKKSPFLSKSFSCSESPYCVRRSSSKSKTKVSRRRKEGETKSERGAQSRKMSSTVV